MRSEEKDLHISSIKQNFFNQLQCVSKLNISYILMKPAIGLENSMKEYFNTKYKFLNAKIIDYIDYFANMRTEFLNSKFNESKTEIKFIEYIKTCYYLQMIDAIPDNYLFHYGSELKPSKQEVSKTKFNFTMEYPIVLYNYGVYCFNLGVNLDWRNTSNCIKACNLFLQSSGIFKKVSDLFTGYFPHSCKTLPEMNSEFLSVMQDLALFNAHILQSFPLSESNITPNNFLEYLCILKQILNKIINLTLKEWKHHEIENYVTNFYQNISLAISLIDVYTYLQQENQKVEELIALLKNSASLITKDYDQTLSDLILNMLTYHSARNDSIYKCKVPNVFELDHPIPEYLVHAQLYRESEFDEKIEIECAYLNERESEVYTKKTNEFDLNLNKKVERLEQILKDLELQYQAKGLDKMDCKMHSAINVGKLMAIFQKVSTSPDYPIDFKVHAQSWYNDDIKLTNLLMKYINHARIKCKKIISEYEKFIDNAYLKVNKAKELDEKFIQDERQVYRQIAKISSIRSFQKFKELYIAEKYSGNVPQNILLKIKQHHQDIQDAIYSLKANNYHEELYNKVKCCQGMELDVAYFENICCIDEKLLEKHESNGKALMEDLEKILLQSSITNLDDGSKVVKYYPNANKWYARLEKYLEIRGPDSQYMCSKSWHLSYQKTINAKIDELAFKFRKYCNESLIESIKNAKITKNK